MLVKGFNKEVRSNKVEELQSEFVVIGGGTAGIMTAAQLLKENNFSDLVTDVIEQKIEDAPYLDNGKGGTGLGQCRINDYKRLKQMVIEFQDRKKYRTKDFNSNLFNSFSLASKLYCTAYMPIAKPNAVNAGIAIRSTFKVLSLIAKATISLCIL